MLNLCDFIQVHVEVVSVSDGLIYNASIYSTMITLDVEFGSKTTPVIGPRWIFPVIVLRRQNRCQTLQYLQ